jgi:hypothetical protein
MNLRRSLRGRLCWGGLPPIVLSFLGTKKHDRERSGFAVTGAVKNGTGLSRFLIAVTGSGLLIGIRFFIPSAPLLIGIRNSLFHPLGSLPAEGPGSVGVRRPVNNR